jgi:hypothetical protein
MIYPIMVTASLLCVWGTAAFMSISGLVSVFGGQPAVAALLAAGMELGKLLAILHLHRNWRSLGTGPRCFYAMVIAALVMVTSIEAAGYLIQSHSQASANVSAARTELAGLTSAEAALRHRIAVIDETLGQLPGGHVSRRISEWAAAGYDGLQGELMANLARQQLLGVELAKSASQAGPVFAFAEMAGVDSGRALLAFVVLLVCIMEPLSIGLAVAASMAWIGRRPKPAEKETAEIGREPETEAAEIGHHEKTEAAEIEQPSENIKTAEIGRDLPSDFMEIVSRHRLTAERVAKITGRAKLKTVEQWLDGTVEIPVKALRDLRRWQETQPRLSLVGR